MTALWSSFAVVVLAEMGDKTQLIAFSLVKRYRQLWTVMLGIMLATLLNHASAATVGVWRARLIPAAVLGVILGLTFVGFGPGRWCGTLPRSPASGHGGDRSPRLARSSSLRSG